MTGELKSTPLHGWHEEHGANMASFASYDMPLWYPTGVKHEHIAVVTNAGLFDTSHMAVVLVGGENARELLQNCFSKDLEKCVGLKKTPLSPGRCVYGVFLNNKGYVIDDAIVYHITSEVYMLVVNAGMGGEIASHLATHNGTLQAAISDLTDQVGKIDIQGPASGKILAKVLTSAEDVFASMPYFTAKGWFTAKKAPVTPITFIDGTPVLVSRTGYTGEFGFEMFLAPDKLVQVWGMLMEAGEEFGLSACGLAARDSLRAGAVLPLSHQDVGEWVFGQNPWDFALPVDEDGSLTKSFFGSDALVSENYDGYTLAFAGYDPRKIPLGEGSFVTNLNGDKIGTILTCATDMAIGRVDDRIVSIATPISSGRPENFTPRGISCGFVKISSELSPGEKLILSDGKRKIKVEIRKDIRPDRTARIPMKKML